MSDKIILIDPNDINLERIIEETNRIQPPNVWVGCSTSSGDEVTKTFRKLTTPADLYPGNFDQIKKCKRLAKKIYLPDPLFCQNPEINNLVKEISKYIDQFIPEKSNWINYIPLHPNCAASKILRLTKTPKDNEVLESLEKTQVYRIIYLEGGSRNTANSISKRKDLIQTVISRYPQSQVICGGGISNPEEVKQLQTLGASVVISHAIHQCPKSPKNYLDQTKSPNK